MTVTALRGNALDLPLADDSVDLCVTSPPYFALRSYTDGGEACDGQVGSEATPGEFLDALIAATREMIRVTKPSGSIFVNLGDKYAGKAPGKDFNANAANSRNYADTRAAGYGRTADLTGFRDKSLMGLPWRYALRCIDDLGLILRAEIIWGKPNGLPESVEDRVRRSHEQWFHFTLEPRYYSAIDHIREEHSPVSIARSGRAYNAGDHFSVGQPNTLNPAQFVNPLGKLPGSVWTIPTEPLDVPDWHGDDHYAAFPTEWPRRIILAWSPAGVCTACGEGRRPVSGTDCTECGTLRPANSHQCPGCGHVRSEWREGRKVSEVKGQTDFSTAGAATPMKSRSEMTHTRQRAAGEACGCESPTAPTTPGVVLDPFGGTGTAAQVASALGRHGISIDLSAGYSRIAGDDWMRRQRYAKIHGLAKPSKGSAPDVHASGTESLFGALG